MADRDACTCQREGQPPINHFGECPVWLAYWDACRQHSTTPTPEPVAPANVCGCWHCGHGSEVHGVNADGVALLRADPNALEETECTACSCAQFILTDPDAGTYGLNAEPAPVANVGEVTAADRQVAVDWYHTASGVDGCSRLEKLMTAIAEHRVGSTATLRSEIADLRGKLERAERERLQAIERLMCRDAECDAATARATELEQRGQALADAAHALVGHEKPRMRLPEREALRNAVAAWDTRSTLPGSKDGE